MLQILKAALAFQIKDALGVDAIEARECELLHRVFSRWKQHPQIEILGNPDPGRRIGVVSFNLKGTGGRYLHPKFVTTLLNDLFGIQSRAGCSCAGPYGHRLLGIRHDASEQYRKWIKKGYSGIKPGWCRVSLHYVMDSAEATFIAEAVEFIAEQGHNFLPLYDFDMATGVWSHKEDEVVLEPFSLEAALQCCGPTSTALDAAERVMRYADYMLEARRLAAELARRERGPELRLDDELEALRFFPVPEASSSRR